VELTAETRQKVLRSLFLLVPPACQNYTSKKRAAEMRLFKSTLAYGEGWVNYFQQS
jgi:hypothetical protein